MYQCVSIDRRLHLVSAWATLAACSWQPVVLRLCLDLLQNESRLHTMVASLLTIPLHCLGSGRAQEASSGQRVHDVARIHFMPKPYSCAADIILYLSSSIYHPLSIILYLSSSIYHSLSIFLYLSFSIYLSLVLYLSLYLSISLSLYLSISLSYLILSNLKSNLI